MTYRHTDREYQAHLNMIRDRVADMSDKVYGMVDGALRAFIGNDPSLIAGTMKTEDEVNALEVVVDDLCVSVLAKRQPVASDLRFIVAILKLVPNLERIGDHAVTICKRAGENNTGGISTASEELSVMTGVLLEMLADFKKAFIEGDNALAEKLISRDATLDAHYSEVFRKALKIIESDPSRTLEAMHVQSVIKNIERMGDHVKNLAELVIYMTGGVDIRHRESSANQKSNIRGVLFLCVHNSARSQMAEALAKSIYPEGTAIYSAGSDPGPSVNPHAIRTMAEIGIDISHQKTKLISAVPLDKVDAVITLCGEEICVDLPVKRSETWTLPDPTRFTGDDENIRIKMAELRDELRFRIETSKREYFK